MHTVIYGEAKGNLLVFGPTMMRAPEATVSQGITAELGETSAAQFKFVQSLERGLAVLSAFDTEHPQQTIADIAKRGGLDRSAARRYLLTLERLGYVGTDGRRFWLRPKTIELGYRFFASKPWWHSAQSVVASFAAAFSLPCAVAILDGDEAVYVAYASAARFPLFSRAFGTRLPAYACAVGRILLASLSPAELENYLDRVTLNQLTANTICDRRQLASTLDQVRDQRMAFVDQELEPGLRSLAVPIADRGGQVTVAISVSPQDMNTTNTELVSRLLEPVQAAARQIAEYFPT